MDNHYSASGIASEALNYLDRGIKTDVTTDHDIRAYYNKPQRLKQLKDPPGQRKTFKKLTYQPIIGPRPSRHAETGGESKRSAEITWRASAASMGITAHIGTHLVPKPMSQQRSKNTHR